MHVKFRRLIAIYAAAALISLGTMAWAAETRLNTYRRAAGYSAARAFEEAVTAAEGLSRSLRALDYVTDPALGKSLCADAQAQALAAETALSVLPFATEQLESLSGFGRPVLAAVDPARIEAAVRESAARRIVIAMAGDSGFFSGTKRMLERIGDLQPRLLPGISSIS